MTYLNFYINRLICRKHLLWIVLGFFLFTGADSSLKAQTPMINGLKGEYFNNKTLTPPAALTRTDATIDFNWTGSPEEGVNANKFSVRWTGEIETPVTGIYLFKVISNDKVRLWINGTKIINNTSGPFFDFLDKGVIFLKGGKRYAIKMEFIENKGGAIARLLWAYHGQQLHVIPSNRLFSPLLQDTQPPIAPTNLTASSVTSTDFLLSWSASTDNVGVTGYEVFRNGVSVGTTSDTSMQITGLYPGITYSMTISARDSVPNWSAQSGILNVTTAAQSTGAPYGYTYIAYEWQTFTLTDTMDIAYGANGQFIYLKNQTGTHICNNDHFGGDPIFNVPKACYVRTSLSTIPVAAIDLAPAAYDSVGIGYTVFTAYSVAPSDASNKTISWTSSNPSVATVNIYGAVKGVAPGTAYITAHSTDGSNVTSNTVAVTVLSEVNNTIHGAYVGNDTASVYAYEEWLGKRTGAILGYTGDANWADYDGSINWASSTDLWGSIDRRVLWSIPLFPRNVGASLSQAAAGAYDDHYRNAAQILANFRPQEPILYIRTGWEFNGDWFQWSAIDSAEQYIGAFRRFVEVFREISPRFKFDWCFNWGVPNPSIPPDQCYPGDDYVDIIGIDIYDETIYSNISDPVVRWESKLTAPYGLNWHREFANEHDKPMSYAEWGVGGNSSGDNPYFIEKMAEWFIENHVIYGSYWNSNNDYAGKLSDNQYPDAGAEYIEHFGVPREGSMSSRKRMEAVPAVEETPDEMLSAYPNPANINILNVQVYAERKGEVSISMISLTANKVLDTKKMLEKGKNTLQISIENLKNGLHLLVINKGRERMVKKIVIDK